MKKTSLKCAVMASVSILFLVNCSAPVSKILVNKDVSRKITNQYELEMEEKESFVLITPRDEEHAKALKREISHLSHETGKCGGFTESTDEELKVLSAALKKQNTLNNSYDESLFKAPVFNENIVKINDSLKIEKLKETIDLLVSQGTRSARASNPNKPIVVFMDHIKKTLKNAKLPYVMDRISHKRTAQHSIRVRVEGADLPEEVVILGGHVDSTTSFFSKKAPGADDNASGSSIVLEVLRVLVESDHRPKRSMEFFWYAGEENGLLGSKEIAKSYKESGVKVVGVMQLDMVLYPGNGDKIGLTTDYTNVELTKFVEDLADVYVGSPVERFKCGYGCSDHASWHQNGFKTVFPFESTFNTSNKNIHTQRDVFNNRSSLEHALKFGKLAVAFLVEYSSN